MKTTLKILSMVPVGKLNISVFQMSWHYLIVLTSTL
ncbi:Uncharacterised protein [Klebsiella quasipneumoniae]|nr:Uncharacterised protein [Klebsiella quasipneumoniae]